MKISSSILFSAGVWLLLLSVASAQGPFVGGGPGGGIYEPGAFRAVDGQVGRSFAWPGSVWFSANWADQGLGYRGSYLTVGAKNRLFEDYLDGRWLFEGRAHVSEEGGFFANLGVERVFSIQSAGADVSLGFWFDYDDDQGAFAFADTLESVGVTGKIKTRHWDLFANGYFPIGTSDMTQGDVTGATSFFQNSLVLVPGIDSGLQGFDVTIRSRPTQLAFVNGSFDFGGYGYESEIVEFFGGGRARLNFQMMRGMIFTGEINYDDRFDVTGLLGMTLVYGANVRGHEYAGLAKDLDRTVRNDHIVRFNQDVVLAVDPDTGMPYNVIHVDNLADAAVGDGSFETPFASLAAAEAASGPDDIIFVGLGDGTSRNYDTTFTAQDGQLLLGAGEQHLVPIANGAPFGSLFELSNAQDGIRPRITADGNAIELASRNTVRGFVIDGADSPGVLARGISGDALVTNTDGIIEDVTITGAAVDGIGITNLAGDWRFARVDSQNNGFSGISLVDACDPTSNFVFDSNLASNNGLDGIQMINYEAESITFTGNETNSNGRDGIRLEGFKGDPMVGTDILIDDHVAQLNNGAGINVIDGAGDLTISNSIIGDNVDPDTGLILAFGGNLGHGISVSDFLTPGASDEILISGNDVTGNGIGGGAGINLELNEGFARALVTGNTADANGTGLLVKADDVDPFNGTPTLFEVRVIDNVSFGGIFGGSVSDGMRFISESGARLDALVEQTGPALLTIAGSGGNGISALVGEDSMGVTSNLNLIVRDVAITGTLGSGVFGSVVDDGQLNILVEDSTSVGGGSGFNFNTNASENLAISSIAIRNVNANANGTGFILDTNPGSFTDVSIIDSTFIGSVGDGLLVNVDGDNSIMNPQIDNRTRLFVQGNSFSTSALGDGIDINVTGDGSLLATIDGNIISGNGDPTIPALDGDGIEINAINNAMVNARITNNQIQGNFFTGVDIVNGGTATINAEFIANNVTGNAGGDFSATNEALSTMCLSFSNNTVFTAPAFATAGGLFTGELDGLTNGPAFVLPAAVTEAAFGSTCDPLIDAEEAAFMADGFPVLPPPNP